MARLRLGVHFEDGVDSRHRQLIVLAAEQHYEATDDGLLIVRRQLDEGRSTACVYEAEWFDSDEEPRPRSIVKVDEVAHLRLEEKLSRHFEGAFE